jgi:hypothetical protein
MAGADAGGDNLRALAEAQSGRLRGLATAMRDHADDASLLTPGTRRIIRSWADTIAEVADELVQACDQPESARRVRRLSKVARALLIPLGIVGAQTLSSVTAGVVDELALPDRVIAIAAEAIEAGFELDDAAGVPIHEDSRFDVIGNVEASLGKAFADLGWPTAERVYRVVLDPMDEDPAFVFITLETEDGERRRIAIGGKDEVRPVTVLNAADQMIERWRHHPEGPAIFRISAEPDGSILLGGA